MRTHDVPARHCLQADCLEEEEVLLRKAEMQKLIAEGLPIFSFPADVIAAAASEHLCLSPGASAARRVASSVDTKFDLPFNIVVGTHTDQSVHAYWFVRKYKCVLNTLFHLNTLPYLLCWRTAPHQYQLCIQSWGGSESLPLQSVHEGRDVASLAQAQVTFILVHYHLAMAVPIYAGGRCARHTAQQTPTSSCCANSSWSRDSGASRRRQTGSIACNRARSMCGSLAAAHASLLMQLPMGSSSPLVCLVPGAKTTVAQLHRSRCALVAYASDTQWGSGGMHSRISCIRLHSSPLRRIVPG
jgi:hypothetical protein